MHQLTPEALFSAVLAARPDAPLVTWYDESAARPARVELSARSLATWAAKTCGLLTDELGLGPGSTVAFDPPAHWLSVGVLAGCWVAGVQVVTGGASGADVAVVGSGWFGPPPDAGEVFTLDPASPLQLSGRDDLLPGSRDLPTALRQHSDRLPGRFAGGPDDPGLDGTSRRDLVGQAQARAAALGLAPGAARLLWPHPLAGSGVLDAVLAPWAVTGSLVLVTGTPVASPERLEQIAATEAVSVTA